MPGTRAEGHARSVGVIDLGEPMTERILTRLGRPRWFWVSAWGSIPMVTPFVLLAALAASGKEASFGSLADLLVPQLVLAYVVVILLWGVGRLTRDATALQPEMKRLTKVDPPDHALPSRSSIWGPTLLTAAIALVITAGTWARFGPLAALAVLPLLTLTVLPSMVFVWTYVHLLRGLDRLGGARLALEPFPQDRSLGLSAVGSLAFTGFVLLVAAAVPVLLIISQDPLTLFISLAVVVVSVPLFFLSMWGLHRQMAAAKARYVAEARTLYAAAYEPLRGNPSVSVLRSQASVLEAARALEERAQRILVWPIDEGLLAITGFVVAGVASGIIVRFVLVTTHL